MKFPFQPTPVFLGNEKAFTLIEVLMAAALAAVMIGGIVTGYVQSSQRSEWSGTSLAAQSLAIQRLEQVRACRWDTEAGVDQLSSTNFPTQVTTMDLPVSGTNFLYGTNFTTVTSISTNAPLLRMIRVDCVWQFRRTGRTFTNTVVTYRGPDN